MNRAFETVMRQMPQIMAGFALVFYLVTVFVAIAAGNEFSAMVGEAVPPEYKIKAFLIVFVQPLVSVMAILFGAALLWRVDRFLANKRGAEAAE